MRIYIAGPLYTPGDRWYLERVASIIEESGHSTFLPHRDVGLSDGLTSENAYYFREDLTGIDASDAVLAILNGTDIDSGTAFELGYAYAHQKRLYGLHEDTRLTHSTIHVNLMITNSTTMARSLQELVALLGG